MDPWYDEDMFYESYRENHISDLSENDEIDRIFR